MNLISTLKKLRNIEPDSHYQMRSRSVVLRATPSEPPARAVWGWFMGNIESAASLALAGLCLFLIFAGFSIWKSFSPLGIARLDLAALHAEAEAIDIQIQLANLRYQESTSSVAMPVPELKSAPLKKPIEAPAVAPLSSTEEIPTSSSTLETTEASTLSIDEALEELAK
ncbi:MAG: hypothetical protein FJY98_01375 [Candidatus Liptonbacteria bacterium]|nr:hypothetical protein [Candidatus Liptonbacteria bacterium]